MFGWASTAWLGGGSGSGQVIAVHVDLLAALKAKGISYNEDLARTSRTAESLPTR